MIRVNCPGCSEKLTFQDELAGQVIQCTQCQKKLRLPPRKVAATTEPRLARRNERDDRPADEPRSARPAPRRDDEDRLQERTSSRSTSRPRKERDDIDDYDDREDEDRAPRSRGKRKRKPTVSLWTRIARMEPFVLFLLLVVVGPILLAPIGIFVPVIFALPLILCCIAYLMGGVWFLLIAFAENPFELLACLFLPFYSVYYLISRFGETCRPFYLQVAALVGFLVTMIFMSLSVGLSMTFWRPSQAPVIVSQSNQDQPRGGKQPDFEFPRKVDVAVAKVTGDARIDKALAELGSRDLFASQEAATVLINMQPNEHREAVAAKLASLASDRDVLARKPAIRALLVWATEKEVPTLIQSLGDSDVFLRQDVLKGIGKFHDPRSVIPVIDCFTKAGTRWEAEKTLRELGSIAEPEVLALLSNAKQGDLPLRQSIVKVLADIGTQLSVPALQALSNDFFLKNPANKALQAIAARANR